MKKLNNASNETFSELQALVDFLTVSNRFQALTHGDLYPVNVYFSAGTSKVYIFDYESISVRS